MNKPEPLSDEEIDTIAQAWCGITSVIRARSGLRKLERLVAQRYEAQIALMREIVRSRTARLEERVCAIATLEAERNRYHDALIARHGGEPVALLDELDAERAKVAALEAERDDMRFRLDEKTQLAMNRAFELGELKTERDALRADAEIPQAIRTIAERIAADKFEHCTADPIFEVQHKRLIAGFDTDYTNKIGWFYDGGRVSDEEELELEKEFEATGKERGDFFRSGYVEEWEHIASYITRESAEEVVRSKGEDYRVYVNSGCRNHEWKAIRSFLLQIARNDAHTAQEPANAS